MNPDGTDYVKPTWPEEPPLTTADGVAEMVLRHCADVAEELEDMIPTATRQMLAEVWAELTPDGSTLHEAIDAELRRRDEAERCNQEEA